MSQIPTQQSLVYHESSFSPYNRRKKWIFANVLQ